MRVNSFTQLSVPSSRLTPQTPSTNFVAKMLVTWRLCLEGEFAAGTESVVWKICHRVWVENPLGKMLRVQAEMQLCRRARAKGQFMYKVNF